MLTRFVRIQLAIFVIVGIIGTVLMIITYVQAPTLLGIGKMTVTLQMRETGGLYRFSNVTYRGVQIGKVSQEPVLTPTGAKVTLSIDTSPNIPADLQAEVRSISAVGEYYLDLRPRTDKGPYLHNGSVIENDHITIPQPISPVLDQTSALVNSIPKGKLGQLLDESFKAFNGAGYDFGSLLDSSAQFSGDLNRVADRARALTEDTGPFLGAQAETADSIRTWARSLAGVTGQLVKNDPQFRTLLERGPGALNEASKLLDQIKPTLPVLLANLTTIGQIGVTYHASIEQVLVLLPPFTAAVQSFLGTKSPSGLATGAFNLILSDPPFCTVGFLPPSEWRNPADQRVVDTPDGLYCKLPQDSPIAVRGARNYPCMGQPGKRAPTVEICESDKPFIPLAQRQHVFGTYPLDPNLIAQGIAPDDRVNQNRERIFGPVDGTPLPPGVGAPPGGLPPPPGSPAATMGQVSPIAPIDVPAGTPPPVAGPPALTAGVPGAPLPAAPPALPAPPAPPAAPAAPAPAEPGAPPAITPSAAPSAFGGGASLPGPSVAIAQYDPHTGTYVAPDGQVYRQSNLVPAKAPKTWKDMFAT